MSTTLTPLWRHACLDVDVVPLPLAGLCRLWLRIRETPDVDGLEALYTVVQTYVRDCDDRFVLHIQHCESDTLVPPDMPRMLTIVGKLMEMRELIDTKLRGTIVQAKQIDGTVLWAKDMFLKMYTPRRAFDLVADDAAATSFVDTLLDRERTKRARRETAAVASVPNS